MGEIDAVPRHKISMKMTWTMLFWRYQLGLQLTPPRTSETTVPKFSTDFT